MRFRALAPLILGLLAFGQGCDSPQPVGGVPRAKEANKIVSLSPSTTEMIGKIGLYNKLVGRTDHCNFPMSFSRVKVVARDGKPDYEAIAALQPDVVVYDSALYSDREISKFKDLKIQVIGWDPNTIEDYEKQCYAITQATGGESNISEYLDKINQVIGDGSAAVAAKGKTGSAIAILLGKTGSYLAPGKKSLWGDITAKVGGSLVAGDSSKWEPISLEQLVKANPKVIIGAGNGKAILNDPALKNVDAVKNKKVYEVDEDVLLRRASRVELLAEAIATAIAKD